MTPKPLLITGASGFAGGWCLRALAGSAQWAPVPASDALDLRRPETIDAEIDGKAPAAVLHLAAQSFVPASFEDPHGTFEVNLSGTLNLLQALERVGFRGRFVYVSTADVYGKVPEDDMPIVEGRAPEPRNPYSVSKLAAEALCRQWHFSRGFDVVVARPFNHIGPGQDSRFVVSGLARQFARMRRGLQAETITAGNLDVSRDFTDVRDVVRAYAGLLEFGEAGGIYNVCSGRATRLQEVIVELESITGVHPEIVRDAALLRPGEQRTAYGSAARLTSATGWSQSYDLRRSLHDTYAYWEQRIADEQD